VKEKIIELIRKIGPIVPTDISKELGIDSYVASAIISEMVKEGKVLLSRKKMTTSPLYFINGQEEMVRARLKGILKIPESNIIDFFYKNKLVSRDNLEPQQRYMVEELNDFIKPLVLKIGGEDKVFYRHYSVSEEDVIEKFNKWQQEVSGNAQPQEAYTAKPEQIEEEHDEAKPLEEKNDFYADSISNKFFSKNDFEISEMNIVKKGAEYDFIVRQSSGFSQTFFVKYYKKSSIGDSDISKAYTSAQSKKMPCIILTNGKVSKKAQELIISLGYMINIIKL
jgi:hypothetical protein